MSRETEMISQIERVLEKYGAVLGTWSVSTMGMGSFRDTAGYHALRIESVAVMNYVYGPDHFLAREFREMLVTETRHRLESARGVLKGAIESIRHGLLADLRTEVLLDVQGDFIDAALAALEGGSKDVAAALAAVVLEDSVKRLARKHKQDRLLDQEFSVVVAGLLSAGAITKATKSSLLSYRDLRNAALHAQWHQVSEDSVRGLLSYLPGFIEQYGV